MTNLPNSRHLAKHLRNHTVLVLGGASTGKTWLTRSLAEKIVETSHSVALVSADIGQSGLGVPSCLGISWRPPWQKPSALWFIGNVSPRGHLLEIVVGAGRLVDQARARGIQTILIDTMGLIHGGMARVLHYHQLLTTGADRILAIQKSGELEPLLALLEGLGPKIHRLTVSPEARYRTAAERRHFRQSLYQAHFRKGRLLEFPRDRLLDCDWTVGEFPDPEQRRPGCLVGLLDATGCCLALGLLENFTHDTLSIYTACSRPAAVSRVQLGRLRLNRQSGFCEV